MIAIADGLKAVASAMEVSGIPYMIVGSLAAAVYGEPRLTRDVDLVVNVSGHKAASILTTFPAEDYYVPPLEIIAQEFSRRGQFNILHMPSGLKVDVVVQKSTDHGTSEFARRRRVELLPGLMTWVAAPEDVIIAKLRYYREGESEKHLRDIRGIKAQISLDQSYLDYWIQELELLTQWKRV